MIPLFGLMVKKKNLREWVRHAALVGRSQRLPEKGRRGEPHKGKPSESQYDRTILGYAGASVSFPVSVYPAEYTCSIPSDTFGHAPK